MEKSSGPVLTDFFMIIRGVHNSVNIFPILSSFPILYSIIYSSLPELHRAQLCLDLGGREQISL